MPNELTQEQKMEQLIKLTSEGAAAIQKVSDNQSAQQLVMEKVQADLTAAMTSSKSFQDETEEKLLQLTDEDKANTKSVFDLTLKNQSAAFSRHGYGDPVTRALYKTHTEYDRRKGWVNDGEAYEVPKSVTDLQDQCYLYGMINSLKSLQSGTPTNMGDVIRGMDTYQLLRFELERDKDMRKALSTSGSGSGSEWVPTSMSTRLVDDIRLALRVAGLFPNLTVPAKVGSMEIPKRGARQPAYLVSENTSDSGTKVPAGTPPTGKATFSMVYHALRMLWSYAMDEDSIVAMFPLIREELVQSLADAAENSIINGDTDSTHFDSDVTSGTDVRKSYPGLRYYSGHSAGEAAVDISTLSTSTLRNIRKQMGRFGVNPSDNAWIPGISGFIQMLSLAEVKTLDVFGPNFTTKSGTLAMFDGAPVVVSEFMREDVNASGVYDGVTTTKSNILLVNTRAHWTGDKQGGLLIESAKDIETLQNVAVASVRRDFERMNVPGTGEASVGIGYNLTT